MNTSDPERQAIVTKFLADLGSLRERVSGKVVVSWLLLNPDLAGDPSAN